MTLKNLRGKILLSLLLGIGVVIVLGLFSDIRAVGASFGAFDWTTLPLILGCTLLNYFLRWLKWDYYLRRLQQGHGVHYGDSVLIFTAGLVMSVTPGKIGEVFKSYLLRRVNGTAISLSAPIVLAERLTDGIAMLLLMALGLTLYPAARPLFIVLVALTVLGIAVVQNRPLCERLFAWVARAPFGAKLAPRLTTLYGSTTKLLDWRILVPSTVLSLVSWGFECIAFYYVLIGLQEAESGLLLLQATFIFAASTLFGLVSFIPGGLGVSEASSAGLLIAIVGMSSSAAATATIIIRFGTLWFGVLLGIAALTWFGQRYRSATQLEPVSAETS